MPLPTSPIMIIAYLIGLLYGPKGVAAAYSVGMMLWIFPAIAWAVRGTGISFRDILLTVKWPLVSGIVAAARAFAVRTAWTSSASALTPFGLESRLIVVVYLGVVVCVFDQRSFYVKLLRGLIGSPSAERKDTAPL